MPLLPVTESVRPLVHWILEASRPDPDRRWAGSGELGTVGQRSVDPDALLRSLPETLAAEQARFEGRARRVADLAVALRAGEADAVLAGLLAQGAAEEGDDHPAEAEGWYLAAFEMARKSGDPRQVEALRCAARTARAQGRLADAARRYEEAWRAARGRGLAVDAVISGTGRGNVAVDRGRWAVAERWYLEALELAASLDPEDPRRDALRWPLAQNLGITAREQGRLDEAWGWLDRGEAWAEAAAQAADAAGPGGAPTAPRHRLDFANGRGQVALARGELEVAIRLFREALLGEGGPLSRIGVRVNLGTALLEAGRTLEAAEAAREAEAEALRHQVVGRLPEVYRLLARVMEARGEAEAFVFLDRALALIRGYGLPTWEEARTLRAYARLRRDEGEVEAADDADRQAAVLEAALAAELEETVEDTPEDAPEDAPEHAPEDAPDHAPEPGPDDKDIP